MKAVPTEAEPITVEFMNELEVLYGEDLQIELLLKNAQGNETYIWDAPELEKFSCLNCLMPMISNVTESFSGSIMITDSEFCQSEIYFNVNVLEDGQLDVPTGFSPNGDNVNDVLFVMGDPDLLINSFTVYSRWGEQVFHSEDFHPGDISAGWNGKLDGKELAQDSYIWVLECEMLSGNIEILKGQTTLIK